MLSLNIKVLKFSSPINTGLPIPDHLVIPKYPLRIIGKNTANRNIASPGNTNKKIVFLSLNNPLTESPVPLDLMQKSKTSALYFFYLLAFAASFSACSKNCSGVFNPAKNSCILFSKLVLKSGVKQSFQGVPLTEVELDNMPDTFF